MKNKYILSVQGYIIAIIIVGAIIRIFYAIGLPLNGDEVGVGVLQASGQAVKYRDRLPIENVSLEQIKGFINFSDEYSVKDVFSSFKNSFYHPPFYYLTLHYFLKYFENGAFTLRLISIIFSLLSIIYLFRLGNKMCNEKVGLLSALLLSVSYYGVKYASMVRPYPLAMLISIISTFQIYNLCRRSEQGFKKSELALYGLTVLIGLYTIYHFIFVLVFQMSFFLIQNYRNKKSLVEISTMMGILFILYIPWLPTLFDQLNLVANKNLYFHGSGFIFYNKFIVIIVVVGGYLFLRNSNYLRSFNISLLVYILSNFVLDKLMNTHTLLIPKLQFFIAPMAFLLIAIVTFSIPKKYYIRTIFMLFCCCSLLGSSIAVLYSHPKLYKEESYLETFPNKIDALSTRRCGLLIINTKQRRYLFALAHAVKNPVDIKILYSSNLETEMIKINNIKNYDVIFIANLYVEYEKETYLSSQNIEIVSNYLAKKGFDSLRLFTSSTKSSLMVYEKSNDMPTRNL